MDPAVRRDMEQAFDTDFRPVRLHTGAQAASLSGRLQAKAFTMQRTAGNRVEAGVLDKSSRLPSSQVSIQRDGGDPEDLFQD